jgi:hypothetical protein
MEYARQMDYPMLSDKRDVMALKAPIERLPADIIDIILWRLSDRDFWHTRRAHRVFRLVHSIAVFKARAVYWWLRASPEELLRRRRGDIFIMLYQRKRVPHNFNPWPSVMKTGDIGLFDAVGAVVAFPTHWEQRVTQYAIERGHLALVMHVHACHPDQPTEDDFVCAVQHHRTAIAMALARLGAMRPHRLVEHAASHGCIGTVSALFEQHGPALSLANVVNAAASNGHVTVLATMAPFVNDPALWVDALFVAAARSSVASLRWIIQTLQPSHDVLGRVVRVASAHGSIAVVDAMLAAHPDLVQWLTDIKCTFKDCCILLRDIRSKIQLGPSQPCRSCM